MTDMRVVSNTTALEKSRYTLEINNELSQEQLSRVFNKAKLMSLAVFRYGS